MRQEGGAIGNGSLEGRYAASADQFGPTTWLGMPQSMRERKRFCLLRRDPPQHSGRRRKNILCRK
ncbi:protein of unknown function [Pararobbsia alpina]